MSVDAHQGTDPSDGKSDAAPSGPGLKPEIRPQPIVPPSSIAERAHQIARARGFVPGREIDDWLEAERELEFGAPRDTPPDNPGDGVRTRSNE